MPNWCMTNYIFHGKKQELKDFHDMLIEWTSKNYTKTDFGYDWLGNILYGAGLQDRIDCNDPERGLRCRGSIVEIEDVYESDDETATFSLVTETAWVPMGKMWAAVIQKLDMDIGFAYEAEEPGCELYEIYDPHGYGDFDDDEYYIDVCLKNGDFYSDYCDEEYAVKRLNAIFGMTDKSLDELLTMCEDYNRTHDDTYIVVHKFEKTNSLYE